MAAAEKSSSIEHSITCLDEAARGRFAVRTRTEIMQDLVITTIGRDPEYGAVLINPARICDTVERQIGALNQTGVRPVAVAGDRLEVMENGTIVALLRYPEDGSDRVAPAVIGRAI